MEDKWNIESQLLLAVLEAEERDEVVYDRFRCILRSDEVKSYQYKSQSKSLDRIMVRTGDQIWELFLECQTILREPLELLWRDYLDGGINNLEIKRWSVDRRYKPNEW